ncbi:MAG: putative metal-dependent hydrolase [Bermanella sp.]|jgi:predicted metal-dependent hydrolase
MNNKQLPSLDFEYKIVRSKRKSVAIHIVKQCVEVRIPNKVTNNFAVDFLTSKQNWVKTKLSEQQKINKALPKVVIGESILWQGKPHVITHQVAKKTQLINRDNTFIVFAAVAPTEKKLHSLFEDFFKQQAKKYLTTLTENTAQKMCVASKLSEVRFRRTKSKWGHCTSKGNIQFNWLVMGAPAEVINYLVIHEVAHLTHPNHQPDFWQRVESYCLDYKTHDKWLKDNGFKLSWC